jgi:hypothetical protein
MEKRTYNMDVIRNDCQSALHCLPAQVQMSRPLFSGRRRHSDEARKSMPVNDHLNQMFQLLVSNFILGLGREGHTQCNRSAWVIRTGSLELVVSVS